MKDDQHIVDMELKKVKYDLRITLTSDKGEVSRFIFGKNNARRLMRAIYLQIGIDPRLDSGHEEVVEGLEKKKGR